MDDSTREKTCFVSAAEMADRLGVRAEAVRRWAHRGLIPHLVLPGGRCVFDPDAVITFLTQLSAVSTPANSTTGGRHG